MRRRTFLGLTGGAAVTMLSSVARAQQAVAKVGFLSGRTANSDAPFVAASVQGIAEAGLVEGRHFAMETRWASGRTGELPRLAAELARLPVNVIVAADSASAIAISRAGITTPTVFFGGGDPVKLGLVQSFNRPGGSMTGITLLGHAITAKRLELVQEIVPGGGAIAYLHDIKNPAASEVSDEVAAAAQSLGRPVHVRNVGDFDDLTMIFDELRRLPLTAALFGAGPVFTGNRQRIVDLVAQYKIPAVYSARDFVEAGGLAGYGADLKAAYVEIGRYAGRIMKGARPADLPVLQPTKFELTINQKTAAALGLAVPPTLLARADLVIE